MPGLIDILERGLGGGLQIGRGVAISRGMAAKAPRVSMYHKLIAVLILGATVLFWGKAHRDDTGLIKEFSLPFFLGAIVIAAMAGGFGIAFHYHRKRQLEELARFTDPPRLS